jgi:hypothetical protein
MCGLNRQRAIPNLKGGFQYGVILGPADPSSFQEASGKLTDRSFYPFGPGVQIQSAGCPHKDHEGQHFLVAQGVQLSVKIIKGCLRHAPPPAGIGNLVEVKLKDLSLRKSFFQSGRLDALDPP